MIKPVCKICGSSTLKPYYQNVKGFGIEGTYDLYQCEQCSTIFTFPYLTRKQLDAYYDSQELMVNGISDTSFMTEYQGHKQKYWQDFGYMRRIDEIRQYFPKAKTLLDIGCGAGLFLDCAKSYGFKVHGLEISKWGYDIATKEVKVPVTKQTLSQIDLKKIGKFDVVTMYDVLEHSDDPVRDLDLIQQLLSKDGIIIINLPNIDSFMSKTVGKHWNKLIPPNHTFFFSPTTLKNLVEKQGFTTKSILTNNGQSQEMMAELAASRWLWLNKFDPAFGSVFMVKAEPLPAKAPWELVLVKSTHALFYRLGFLIEPFKPALIKRNLGEGIRLIATKKN